MSLWGIEPHIREEHRGLIKIILIYQYRDACQYIEINTPWHLLELAMDNVEEIFERMMVIVRKLDFDSAGRAQTLTFRKFALTETLEDIRD